MVKDDLMYFRGWKDACDDVAGFLEHLADHAPEEVELFTRSYRDIAKSIRTKGEVALSMAESIQERLQ